MKRNELIVLAVLITAGIGFMLWRDGTFTQPAGSNAQTARGSNSGKAMGPPVSIEITSDPSGAFVIIDGRQRGTTPLTLEVAGGSTYEYRIAPAEPYLDYKLYKPFVGTFTADEDKAISVWVERTTSEEQQVQREAVIAARAEAELERCRNQVAQATIIIENWRWSRTAGGSFVRAEGRVTNNTTSTLRNIQALVEYETSSGQFITSDYSTIDLRDLLPGQSSPFSVLTSYNPAMQRGYLRFREFFGATIPTINRSEVNC